MKDGTNKIIAYCLLGSVLEWYDFTIFGTLATILAAVIFPNQTQTVSLLFVFAVFGAASCARPFGGLIIGHIGDRYGRKTAVVWSALLMTAASAGFACLPTGGGESLAVILSFVALRIMQGLSFGGEYSGLIVFFGELSDRKHLYLRQGILLASTFVGAMLGMAAAKSAATAYHNGHLYAWRIPFAAGILLGAVAWWLRAKACESPVFLQMTQRKKTVSLPIKTTVLRFYQWVIPAILIIIPPIIMPYYAFIYMPTYLIRLGMPSGHAMGIGLSGIVLAIILAPISSYLLRDKVIRATQIALWGFLILPPLMGFAVTHVSLNFAIAAQILYVLCVVISMPLVLAFFAQSFPANIRFTATALCINVAAIFGGLSPFLSQLLVKWTGLGYAPGFYIACMALIAVVTLFVVRKKLTAPTVAAE